MRADGRRLSRSWNRWRKGLILLSVCWCVLILALLLAARLRQVELAQSEERQSEVQFKLQLACRCVENLTLAAMAEKASRSQENPGQKPDEIRPITEPGSGAKMKKPDSEGPLQFDAYSDIWGWEPLKEQFGEELKKAYPDLELSVAVEDEDSKLDLRKVKPERLALLLHELGRSKPEARDLAEALLKLTAAGNPTPKEGKAKDKAGASGPGAQFLDLRYLLKLPALSSLELYGEDANFNSKLDPEENDGAESLPPDNRDGSLQEGLTRFVTVVGDGRVNPNLAPLEILLTVPGVSRKIAEEIVTLRQGGDGVPGTKDDFIFKKPEDLKQLSSLSKFDELEYSKMAPVMRMSSNCYTLKICARNKRTGQVLRRQSCFKREDKGKFELLGQLEDDGC